MKITGLDYVIVPGAHWDNGDILQLTKQEKHVSNFDGKESELVVGKLRGFRGWRATSTLNGDFYWNKIPWGPHSRLASLSYSTYWSVNNMQARCQIRIPKPSIREFHKLEYPHQAPTDGCSCGIYGHYKLSDTVRYGNALESSIFGAFDAWGKVLLGTSGFRCQYAKITALASNKYLTRLKHIASYYGVPHFYDYAEFSMAFPQADLTGLVKPVLPEFNIENLANGTGLSYQFWTAIYSKYGEDQAWNDIASHVISVYARTGNQDLNFHLGALTLLVGY